MADIEAGPGAADDVSSALELLYGDKVLASSLPAAERCRQALAAGEVSLLVARRKGSVAGAMLYRELAGALALLFPPHAASDPERTAVEDSLVRTALARLRGHGVKLCQALVEPAAVDVADCWRRNGFFRMGSLYALSRHTDPPPAGRVGGRLTFAPFSRVERGLFARTLEQTYEDSLDSPELNGVRTVEEEIQGHASHAQHDPSRWWLVFEGGSPVGVLLAATRDNGDEWDLVYMGLVKSARGRGLGRELVDHVLAEARAAGARRIFLTVDARNAPALAVYQAAGFRPCGTQAVFLWVAPPAGQ